MVLTVGLRVVGLLENLVCADARGPYDSKTLDIERRGVDIDSPYRAITFFYAVHLSHRVRDVFGRIVAVLPVHQNQTLLAFVLKRLHFPA